MSRMTAHRTAMAGAALAPLLLTVWAAGPAQAHGAPTYPVSRVYACSPQGGSQAGSAACKAAIAANGAPFTYWDNLRVPDINGRDRQLIPDGKLCSGGLPDYKGLNLARTDWPSTRLTPGAKLTMTYASTIAHTGTFKLYLTKAGYDPAKPLTWSELPTTPFAEVKDPPLTGGAYRINATLPTGRTGRQLIYTIWQNSSTEDTYYSCSDVVFPGGTTASTPSSASSAGKAASKGRSASPSSSAVKSPTAASSSAKPPASATAQKASPAEESTAPGSSPVASDTDASGGPSAPMMAGGAAAVLVLTGGAALALRLRRR
ncbi:lytic polysaccharide monooxygenase [Streptomyces sp. NBC_01239]|uniref:lytic polysaccharide monooxygenase auxiliary activity family 9 protein n=1 Tax=Streptomyces sp. NBC_01239 TaxID=2903792 RepID=UPI0022533B39|nr:lytic polysaccharide monooxygenase [Streptomyces sp. NBC_01239]MCX4814667.1 lytic polysaccharide monooxygenase [Streptomyces sp. NBC_01239]